MKKLMLLFATVTLSSLVNSQVMINSYPLLNPPATSCTNTVYQVSGNLSMGSYTFDGVTYTVVGSVITINVNYSFSGVGIPVITPFSQNANIGLLTAGIYTVYINGVLNGSVTSAITTSLSVTNCCNALPAFTANVANVCVGDSILLTNTSTGTTSQIWSENNVQTSTNFEYGMVPTAPGTIVFELVVTNGICSDSIEQTVTVFDPPVISSVTPSATVVCEGEPISFTGVATGVFNYTWYKDNVFAGSGNTFNTIASGAGMHIYSLIALSACADTMDVTVEFLATPTFDTFTVNDDSLCLGETVVLTSTTTGSTSETWYEDNIMAGTGNNLSTTPTSVGFYVYKLTITDGVCSDSSELSVEVFGLPTVDLGPDTSSCQGVITLDAGAGMTSYEWQDLSSNQTLVADSGTYYVTVTDVNGCQATDTIEVVNCASLGELNLNSIIISPNPTSSIVSFDLGETYTNLEVQVVDVRGKVVLEEKFIGTNSVQLDFTKLESGAYFVKFDRDGSFGKVKVVRK